MHIQNEWEKEKKFNIRLKLNFLGFWAHLLQASPHTIIFCPHESTIFPVDGKWNGFLSNDGNIQWATYLN